MINLLDVSISIGVSSAKLKSDLNKVTAEGKKAAKEVERIEKAKARAIVKGYKSHAREAAKTAKLEIRAAEKAAKAVIKAHQKMVRRVKRAYRNMTTSASMYSKYAIAAFVAVGVASAKMAMDVQDSEDFFEMSMGKMSDSTRMWSEEFAESTKRNQYKVRETVATFNEMTSAMGLSDEAAAKLSQRYTKLAYDLESYHPKVQTLEQASIVLQGALTGERETLKRLGYYYSENEVRLKAIELGYGKNTQALTALQKLEINDIIITEKMVNVHGDLARTQGQTKNVLKSLKAQIELTAISFGTDLLPAITEIGEASREWLVENQQDVIDMFMDVITVVGKVVKVYVEFYGVLKDINEALVDHNKGLEFEYTQNEKLLKVQKERLALGKKTFNIAEGVLAIGRKKPELGGFGGMGVGAGYKNILKKAPVVETREELPWGKPAEIDTSGWKDPSYAVTPAAPSVFGDDEEDRPPQGCR